MQLRDAQASSRSQDPIGDPDRDARVLRASEDFDGDFDFDFDVDDDDDDDDDAEDDDEVLLEEEDEE